MRHLNISSDILLSVQRPLILAVDKRSYPPLLPPGRFKMSLEEVRLLCVADFPDSSRRERLFAELASLFDRLQAIDFTGEIWIDGSFLSSKQNPEDIDLTLIVHADVLSEKLAIEFRQMFGTDRRFSEGLDAYVAPYFDREDPRALSSNRDYWAEWWGTDREGWLTGFAVVGIGETDVQRQLSA